MSPTDTIARWRVQVLRDEQTTPVACPRTVVQYEFTSSVESTAREAYENAVVPVPGLVRLQFRPSGASRYTTVLERFKDDEPLPPHTASDF